MSLRCSSPEELSIFLIDQGSTWGRAEQAFLDSDELLVVEKLFLLNTLCTVGFPGIQGKPRFVTPSDGERERDSVCVCMHWVAKSRKIETGRREEISFSDSEVSLVTQGCCCLFLLCFLNLYFSWVNPGYK